MAELLFPQESYKIIGACFNVYNTMGSGFLEDVYQECLEIEFEFQSIPFQTKPELLLKYRDRVLRQKYKPDFVCHEQIVIEIKAVSALTDQHRAQMVNYLHSTGKPLGILINFGNSAGLKYERFLLNPENTGIA